LDNDVNPVFMKEI